MHTLAKLFKFSSLIALVAALVLLASAGYAVLTQLLVCAVAIMAALESFQTPKPALATVFILFALGFNPVFPLSISQPVFLGVAIIAFCMFTVSVMTFHARRRLSMASTTDRTPGSESL